MVKSSQGITVGYLGQIWRFETKYIKNYDDKVNFKNIMEDCEWANKTIKMCIQISNNYYNAYSVVRFSSNLEIIVPLEMPPENNSRLSFNVG